MINFQYSKCIFFTFIPTNFQKLDVKMMKVLVVCVLFGALVAAIPMPSEEVKSVEPSQNQQHNQDALLSADANAQGDNAKSAESANRSKRFFFFSKLFYPYPVATYSYTPVVTPIVTKTKVVAPAPVAYTYKIKPVTYQYTYSVPQIQIVKAAPIVKTVSVAAPAVSVTKTVAAVSDDDEGYE